MPNATWKATERAVARRLGGERVPAPGRAGRPDVQHPVLSVEVKTRRRVPAWLLSAIGQAVRAAGPGQVGVVVLHQTGRRHDDDLVLLRLADFCHLIERNGNPWPVAF